MGEQYNPYNEDGSFSLAGLDQIAAAGSASTRKAGTTGLRTGGAGLDISQGGFGTDYRVTFPPTPIYARIVGAGSPLTTSLNADFALGATTMEVKELSGSVNADGKIEAPPTPFEAKVGSTAVVVTKVENRTWTVTRAETGYLVATMPTYPAGTSVEVLRSRPFAFVEVSPAANGTFYDTDGGQKGVVKDAKLTAAGGKIILQDLGEEYVTKSTPSGNTTLYAGAKTSMPAFEVNGIDVPTDGSTVVQLWPVPGQDAFAFVAAEPAPFYAFVGGGVTDLGNYPTLTTLTGTIAKTDTLITVATGAERLPPYPSSTAWRISIDSEVMLAQYSNSATTWSVTRGIDGTQPAEHSGGATVKLAVTGYAWQEAALNQFGIWERKPDGRSSNGVLASDAVLAGTGSEPAYCLSPTRQPPYADIGSVPVLLRPGPAPHPVTGTTGLKCVRHWVFEWPGHPACGWNSAGVIPSTGNVHLGRGERGVDKLIVAPTGYDDDTFKAALSVDTSTGYVTLASSAGGFIIGPHGFSIDPLTLYTTGHVVISGSAGKFRHNDNAGLTQEFSGYIKNMKVSGGIVWAAEVGTGISGTVP